MKVTTGYVVFKRLVFHLNAYSADAGPRMRAEARICVSPPRVTRVHTDRLCNCSASRERHSNSVTVAQNKQRVSVLEPSFGHWPEDFMPLNMLLITYSDLLHLLSSAFTLWQHLIQCIDIYIYIYILLHVWNLERYIHGYNATTVDRCIGSNNSSIATLTEVSTVTTKGSLSSNARRYVRR
jgi:hypothetical protein